MYCAPKHVVGQSSPPHATTTRILSTDFTRNRTKTLNGGGTSEWRLLLAFHLREARRDRDRANQRDVWTAAAMHLKARSRYRILMCTGFTLVFIGLFASIGNIGGFAEEIKEIGEPAQTRSVVSPRQRKASSYATSAPPSSFVPATMHVRAPGRALLLLLLLLTVVPPVTQAAATRKTSSRRSSSRLLVALPTVLSSDSSSALEVRHSCLFCLCAVLRICCLSGPDLTDPKARLPPHIGFVCVFLYAALLTMVLREAERDVTPRLLKVLPLGSATQLALSGRLRQSE